MEIYEKDSDHFTAEWLDYLDSLRSEVGAVGDNRVRTSKDKQGRIVRIEIWYPYGIDHGQTTYGYHDLHLPGWMEP